MEGDFIHECDQTPNQSARVRRTIPQFVSSQAERSRRHRVQIEFDRHFRAKAVRDADSPTFHPPTERHNCGKKGQ